MEVEAETPIGPPIESSELIRALEQATQMAKQLHTTTDQSQLLQIQNSLHSANRHLSLFLSKQPHNENSHSQTSGAEPMEMENDHEQSLKDTATAAVSVSKVEERMSHCFIRNKRPKRQLSPSAVIAEQRRGYEDHGGGGVVAELEYVGSKFRAFDLIYQFHA